MEQAEFEHIATRLRRKVLAKALVLTGDSDKAEDIAQETMLKLWTLRSEINGREHIERLASCIARHRAIDYHRRQVNISLDTNRDIVDDHMTGPDRLMEDKETMKWLEERLASLPSTEYQILWLRQVEHKSHEEIARIVGVGKPSVSTLLSRARNRMLNEFKKRTR